MTASKAHASVLKETPEEIEYERRAAEGALWTGTRLLIGIAGFAFASLAFAYFYLRSANNEDLWRPGGVTASTGLGTAIFLVTVGAAVLLTLGTARLRQASRLDWIVAGWFTVGAGLLAVVLQIWELVRLNFYPGSSGYASCFVAWAVMNIALLLGSTYWIETLLARSMRLHRALVDEGAADSARSPAESLFNANASGCVLFWQFTAVAATFFWLLFYII